MLADTDYIAHGTTSSLNALVTGKRGRGRVPHHQGPPRLDLHHERRGPLPRPVAARAAGHVSASASRAPLLPKRPGAGGHRADRPRRERRRRPRRGRGRAGRSARCWTDGVRAIARLPAVVVPQPGARAAAARADRTRSTPDVFVALSSEVSPRIREFARNATTIMSTQIGPRLRDYLLPLEAALRERGLGRPAAGHAEQRRRRRPRTRRPAHAISTVGSVLTGGVVGRIALGRQLGHRNIISTDVGGTTFLAGLDRRRRAGGRHHHGRSTTTRSTCRPLRVDAIGSGGGAHRLARRGRQPAHRPAQRAGRARARLLRRRRHRADQHRRQPGARHPPRAGPARRAQAAVASSSPARPSTRTIAKPLGLTVEEAAAAIYDRAERADRRPAAQDRRRGGPRPPRLRRLRLRRRRPRALRPLRRGARRHARSSCRSGPWRRRSRRSGSRPRTSC